MDDGTWGFLTTLERIDTEPPLCLRQFLLCWECFTKTFPLPLISLVWDLRWGLVDFCLKKRYFSEAKPSCCLSVIFSIFMPNSWQICLCYLTQRLFFYLESKAHTPPDPRRSGSALLNKSNASQGNLIETLRDLWTEWIEQRAWLSANTASNGELESAGSIDLPVTFTRLA